MARPAVYEDVSSPKARGVIDFEDVLLTLRGMLDAMTSRRPSREQYRHFVVDEYQDVNARSSRRCSTPGLAAGTTCVVGDPSADHLCSPGPRRSIFAGSASPPAPAGRLVRNYRSTPRSSPSPMAWPDDRAAPAGVASNSSPSNSPAPRRD